MNKYYAFTIPQHFDWLFSKLERTKYESKNNRRMISKLEGDLEKFELRYDVSKYRIKYVGYLNEQLEQSTRR